MAGAGLRGRQADLKITSSAGPRPGAANRARPGQQGITDALQKRRPGASA